TPAAIPTRVHAVVAPVIVAGAGAFGFALFRYADAPRSASDLAALLGLLASMALAERFPVPVEGMGAGGVTLGFVFSVSSIILLGWQPEPALSIALVGPLLAIALYQRSTFKAIRAMRLALTDPLTGLGNHRSFHERLQRELVVAEEEGTSLALCLVDFDDLKSVNDRFGHPVGDLVLGQVASRLRQGGESFRLGGDEFAVLLPR